MGDETVDAYEAGELLDVEAWAEVAEEADRDELRDVLITTELVGPWQVIASLTLMALQDGIIDTPQVLMMQEVALGSLVEAANAMLQDEDALVDQIIADLVGDEDETTEV